MYLCLLLSFCALIAGPILAELAAKQRLAWRFLDAFILFSIAGIVVFQILPHAITDGGVLAIIAVVLGLLGPFAFSRLQTSFVSIASIGLVIHSLFDGFALATIGNTNAILGVAIVLHRFPEGLGIWRLTGSTSSKRAGILAISGIAVATVIGFFFGDTLITYTSEEFLLIFESLIAGVLLHVVCHKHHSHENTDHHEPLVSTRLKWGTGVGAFCGFFLVVILSSLPGNQHAHAQVAPEQLCCYRDTQNP